MKKIKLFILIPIIFALSGCGISDLAVNGALTEADLAIACADRDVDKRFENRIIATTSSVEEKYAALNILVGPATVPFAGAEAMYVGAKNFYDSIVNSEQSKAADKRCEGVE